MGGSSSGTDDLRALLALPEDLGAELILGTITRKAAPSFEHGDSQSALSQALKGPFHRRPGGPGGPGGWWIATEVDVWFDDANVLRPDLVGWRRDRLPAGRAGLADRAGRRPGRSGPRRALRGHRARRGGALRARRGHPLTHPPPPAQAPGRAGVRAAPRSAAQRWHASQSSA